MRPGFRFFVLDSTRQWIECAIVVRNDRIHQTGSSLEQIIVAERETAITDFCETTTGFPNLLSYDHWPRDSRPRVKMIFDQTGERLDEKWVKYHPSDAVIYWARSDHFNALARIDSVDKTVQEFVWTALRAPQSIARVFP